MFRFKLVVAVLTMIFSICLITFLPQTFVSAKEIDQNTISLWTFDEAKGNTAADLQKKDITSESRANPNGLKVNLVMPYGSIRTLLLPIIPVKPSRTLVLEMHLALNFGSISNQ